MKVLAFAASTSRNSINKKLAGYAASLIKDAEIELIDLNDYEIPLFSEDREKELGQPQKAQDFLNKIGAADALIISFAEHNGSYAAAYKNLFDWCTRITRDVYQNKPAVLLATSPGSRGGLGVLATAESSLHRFACDVKASLSIPSFFDNFNVDTNEFSNSDLLESLKRTLKEL